MKIVFTGGGTGGHFYPIIAVAESIQKIAKQKKLITPEMYFFAPSPYNPGLLYEYGIKYKKVAAGKRRRYFSLLNFTDIFKTGWGILSALLDLFDIYPDVIFSKGGYGSFPTLVAARLLRVPIFIHESDSAPGRVNKWAGKFAARVALSYKEAATYFKGDKAVYTGQPILEEHLVPLTSGANEFFGFDESLPTIFIMGGSQGAETINNAILDILPELVKEFQIIHQTGPANLEVMKQSAAAILLENPNKNRYKPLGYLNNLEMRMAAGAATLVVSRGGSSIFEIASWQKPAIVIPLADSNDNHQIKNAYLYARSGACSVIEETNLKPNLFLSEIKRIMGDSEMMEKMKAGAKDFGKPGAAARIAEEIFAIGLSHEE